MLEPNCALARADSSRDGDAAITGSAATVDRYERIRARSLALAAPLSAEDAQLQSMPDASPAKWHLAHTSWFFETFVLAELPGYRALDARWSTLFNSYYQAVGPRHARPQRGVLSRPSLDEVIAYRKQVDARMREALAGDRFTHALLDRIELGLHHEQQHQELLLTDLLHAFSCNPLRPAYRDDLASARTASGAMQWQSYDEAVVVGAAPWPADGGARFSFDQESPPHRVLLGACQLATRPVSCGEYRDFIHDRGYAQPTLWLSDGWDRVQAEGWQRPLYWADDDASVFTLAGQRDLDADAPVSQLSYFEADAFARWAGARLPTEFEWERAARDVPVRGNFADAGLLQPAGTPGDGMRQLFGDVWEWTSSAYSPYPGFRPLEGALGEYNGKFMCGQQVLRGGSCASPADHLRATYRNFFPPHARWQFAGVRLARDVS